MLTIEIPNVYLQDFLKMYFKNCKSLNKLISLYILNSVDKTNLVVGPS